MAYINKEKVQNIRKALKKEFPTIKFSVRKNAHSSVLYVTILQSDIDFLNEVKKDRFGYDPTNGGYMGVNIYSVNETMTGKSREVLAKIDQIVKEVGEWYDRSDSMTDYFDTAFYCRYSVGTSEKPYQLAA